MQPRFILYVLVFVGTLATSLALTPLAMRLANRWGIMDRPSPGKFHTVPTPYLGGLAVAAGLLVLFLVPGSVRTQTLVILGSALLVGSVGLLDDWRPLGLAPRLASQVAAGTALWIGQARLTPTGWDPLDFAITLFVVLAVTNAFNLLDNMDGLVPGTAAIAAGYFFAVSYPQGQILVALLCAALAGACVGFLPYNLGPARIFLGDAGALFMGFLLAVVAIKIDLPQYPFVIRAAVPWLILAVPLFDMTLVVVSRIRGGRRVFRGSTDHSSHRMVALGASPSLAALITYLAAAFSGGAALLLLEVNSIGFASAMIVGAIATAIALGVFLERVDLGTTGVPGDAGSQGRSGPT
jgi:UDP-GlcNAc:undecaprenyl-phosphate/decaprenyl-phosphate GlcNAc-1-phosphate transferase